MIVGMVLAGLCLIRVLTVAAAPRAAKGEDVEIYSAVEQDSDAADDDSDSRSSDESRAEIRLSRPEEAEARVDKEQGYDLVPGVERVLGRSNSDELMVPKKVGRRIASEPALPESPVGVRAEAADAAVSAHPTGGHLTAEVMEPTKPFTSRDAAERASEFRRESIVASNTPPSQKSFGLHAEPRPDTVIDPPVPATSGARNGVQEISVIVSDYGYFPNRIFVTQNVPVKIYLTTPSKVTMCFMLDTWGLKKGVVPGKVEELTFTPEAAGNYRFYCPVKSIEGTLTVREAGLAGQSSRGVAAVEKPVPETAGVGNEPKNAAQLRSLIED